MPVIDFPEYAPDLTDIGTGISPLIEGCVPRKDGYGPYPQFAPLTAALPSACHGMFYARKTDGTIAVVAATATDIYILNNLTATWTKVSKGGVAYTAVPPFENWEFVQFADTVIAVQANTVPQKFALSSDTAFGDLGGSPPSCSHVTIIGGFLVLSGIVGQQRRVQWSDLFGITTWTAGVGYSDFQDYADGGKVLAVRGGDLFGVVFQEEKIRSMIYAPGSAAVFNMQVISEGEGLLGAYSPIFALDKVYYLSTLGFRVVSAGATAPIPIGKERVDRTVLANLDVNNLQLLQGAADPSGSRVFWAYRSLAGAAGAFDKLLCFDFALNKWSILPFSGEMLASFAVPTITLEGLDAIVPTQISITGAANNGSGHIRLTVSALTAGPFTLGTVGSPSMNFVQVQGVVGTTEANGSWPYTIIDSTHIDLVGSTFTNAYVSGGKIGGSMDAGTVTMDAAGLVVNMRLGAFNSSHYGGYFAGTNMEAIIETGELDADGMMSFVSAVRPITDAAAGLVSIGYRNTAQGAVSYSTPETAIEPTQGQAPCLVEARYMKARLRIPAGSAWSFAKGVQPEVQVAGDS